MSCWEVQHGAGFKTSARGISQNPKSYVSIAESVYYARRRALGGQAPVPVCIARLVWHGTHVERRSAVDLVKDARPY